MPELQQATSLHVKYILILICDIWHWSCRDWLIRFQVHTTRRGRDNEKRLALFQTLHFIWVKAACSQNSYRTNKLITYWTIFCHFLKTLINSGIKVIKILSRYPIFVILLSHLLRHTSWKSVELASVSLERWGRQTGWEIRTTCRVVYL